MPPWFFSPEHLHMVDDQGEARAVGMASQPTGIFRNPSPRSYLDMHYTDRPHRVSPYGGINGEFLVELSDHVIRRLLRRFPAIQMGRPEHSWDFDTLVLSSGHIQLRTRQPRDLLPTDVPRVSDRRVNFTAEGNRMGPAAYEIETTMATATQPALRTPTHPASVDNRGHLCDATNSSLPNGQDQTGGPRANYHTLTFPNGTITVDRERVAGGGQPEPHKLWVLNEQGRFRKHRPAMRPAWNWRDHKAIVYLNSWRSTAFKRAGFDDLRPDPRFDYTVPERQWLLE